MMAGRNLLSAGALAAALLLPTEAVGQDAAEPAEAEPADTRAPVAAERTSRSLLRIGKWASLSASTAAAGIGFLSHTRAERRQSQLEDTCAVSFVRCAPDFPGGPYPDAEVQRLRTEVRTLDRRARVALTASQIGAALTVLLFVFDLGGDEPPPNVVYEPQGLELIPRTDGSLEIRTTIPLGRR